MKLIIIDRDGVINYDSEDFIKTPREWIAIPGSLKALAKLTSAGYTIAVATNQSGISLGLYDEETLTEIHEKMNNEVEQAGGRIDSIDYCPHSTLDDCLCRKPKPGLLQRISERFAAPLENVYFIGDKLKDFQTSVVVGCKFALVRTGYGEETLASGKLPDDTPVFEDLASFVNDLLE